MTYYNRYKKTERIKYYKQFLIDANLLKFFITKLDKKDSVLINYSITLNGLEFGCSPQKIATQIGNPDFIIEDSDLIPLVYLYKETALRNKVISQFHFIDNEYAFASKTFIGFEKGWKSKFKMALYKKYLSDSSLNQNTLCTLNNILIEKCICFKDSLGNKIVIVDDVFLHVLYVSAKVNLTKILLEFRIKENKKEIQKLNSIQEVLFEFI